MLCQNALFSPGNKQKKTNGFNLPGNIEATQSSLLLVVNDAIMQMAYFTVTNTDPRSRIHVHLY